MFCWTQKHNICKLWLFDRNMNDFSTNYILATHAYDELVDIIRNPQFKSEDVVSNCRRFRKYRQRLPLLPIRSRRIHISSKKTPTTSNNTGNAYCFSIADIIHHVLNNPLSFSNMYFGPGQEVTKNKELWHGNIWKESPRFGQASIIIAEGNFVICFICWISFDKFY